MNERQIIGQAVAYAAAAAGPALIGNPAAPSVTSGREAQDAIARVVTQSPLWASQRAWASVLALLTAMLSVPEVQALLGAWAPVVTAAVSALLAAWSKAADPRPPR